VVGVAVLAVWVSVTGLHVRREYFRPEAERLAAGARQLAPGAHWYIIRLDDAAIGIAQSALDTVPDGYTFRDEITLDVPALGRVHRSLARTNIGLGPALELRTFRFALDSEIGRFAVSGTADGDSVVSVTMDAGGGPQQSRMNVPGGLLLDAAMTLRWRRRRAARRQRVHGARVRPVDVVSEREVAVRVTERDDRRAGQCALRRWPLACERCWTPCRSGASSSGSAVSASRTGSTLTARSCVRRARSASRSSAPHTSWRDRNGGRPQRPRPGRGLRRAHRGHGDLEQCGRERHR
jgi:hypothetical protein